MNQMPDERPVEHLGDDVCAIYEPSKQEKADGMVTKNARTCSLCNSMADRYSNRFQCQLNPNHMGDLFVGIFTDLTNPSPCNSVGVNERK